MDPEISNPHKVRLTGIMDEIAGTPLLEMKNLQREKSINNGHLKSKNSAARNPLIRAVRRGIRMTEKFLDENRDIKKLRILDTNLNGRNIFHLSVQWEELLELLLDKFKKHDQFIQALHSEDENGHTPAHIAVLHNERKSMHMLAEVVKNIYSIRSTMTGQTLIHCAVETCNPYIVQDILEARPDALFDKDKNSRLPQHYAAALEENFLLEHLLSQGADVFETDKDNSTSLHVAAEAGSISNVKLLVCYDEDLMRAEDKSGRTALHVACMKGFRNIVSFLLEAGSDPFAREEKEMDCLEVAVYYKQENVVEELLLSDRWKELIHHWKGGAKKCFAHLVSKMPGQAKTLLDRCVVKSKDNPQSADYNVAYDFFLLEPTGHNPPKFDSLEAIIENNQEQCMTHNLCRKYFSVKWREKGCYLYLTNLFIYLCFHILFNVYVALVRGAIVDGAIAEAGGGNASGSKALFNVMKHGNNGIQAPILPLRDLPDPHARPDDAGAIAATVVIVAVTVFNIIKELAQLHSRGWSYFKQVVNYFEWTLYFCVLYFMFPIRSTKTEWQFGAGAVAVCISWYDLIWFLRRIPNIGTYILTIEKVFKTLVKMLLLIALFCMAFASTFYLLFADAKRFKSYPIAVLSTFVSMLGDFRYDDLFVEVGYYKDFHGFKLAMFVVFVLLMVIVVNNVLIGLAVGDTEYVMNLAKVERLKEEMGFIMEIECSMFRKFHCLKKSKITTYTEYPNHERSFADNFNRLLAGEWHTFYDENESDDENGDKGLTEEKIEEIVQARLEDYHKKIIQELKDFHADMVEKWKD